MFLFISGPDRILIRLKKLPEDFQNVFATAAKSF